nr:hypothetical protein Iba_chr15dCG5680 [Ipomoea batatas]
MESEPSDFILSGTGTGTQSRWFRNIGGCTRLVPSRKVVNQSESIAGDLHHTKHFRTNSTLHAPIHGGPRKPIKAIIPISYSSAHPRLHVPNSPRKAALGQIIRLVQLLNGELELSHGDAHVSHAVLQSLLLPGLQPRGSGILVAVPALCLSSKVVKPKREHWAGDLHAAPDTKHFRTNSTFTLTIHGGSENRMQGQLFHYSLEWTLELSHGDAHVSHAVLQSLLLPGLQPRVRSAEDELAADPARAGRLERAVVGRARAGGGSLVCTIALENQQGKNKKVKGNNGGRHNFIVFGLARGNGMISTVKSMSLSLMHGVGAGLYRVQKLLSLVPSSKVVNQSESIAGDLHQHHTKHFRTNSTLHAPIHGGSRKPIKAIIPISYSSTHPRLHVPNSPRKATLRQIIRLAQLLDGALELSHGDAHVSHAVLQSLLLPGLQPRGSGQPEDELRGGSGPG